MTSALFRIDWRSKIYLINDSNRKDSGSNTSKMLFVSVLSPYSPILSLGTCQQLKPKTAAMYLTSQQNKTQAPQNNLFLHILTSWIAHSSPLRKIIWRCQGSERIPYTGALAIQAQGQLTDSAAGDHRRALPDRLWGQPQPAIWHASLALAHPCPHSPARPSWSCGWPWSLSLDIFPSSFLTHQSKDCYFKQDVILSFEQTNKPRFVSSGKKTEWILKD